MSLDSPMILNNRYAELSFELFYILKYIDEFRIPIDVKSSNFLPDRPQVSKGVPLRYSF